MHLANPSQTRRVLALDSASQTVPGRIFLAIAASALVAVAAHVSLPLPFTPVPLTLGNAAVLLVGLMLGPATAFGALVLYLVEGAMGLPVFTPTGGPIGIAHLLGPNAGYLFAYPAAAAIASAVVRNLKFTASRFTAAVLACSAATVVILSAGSAWLAVWMHLNLVTALKLGAIPFLAAEALKIAAAAGIYAGIERWKRA
ncbi:biotin transport system substrate-specific component [Granulicella rosea]|uniref:Biotin transporter n=1 Tax=Granulicella rosea TaxID=474952 RepID=A0A239GXW1_9BACT|nr:biotin transporter BioY [Granulicella rosea]SNS73715.1 biotin transport system substrate-specific component [Granulicella rosea]